MVGREARRWANKESLQSGGVEVRDHSASARENESKVYCGKVEYIHVTREKKGELCTQYPRPCFTPVCLDAFVFV